MDALAERLQAACHDASLRWIDGAGHYPQLEAPEAYLVAPDAALG